MGYVFTDYNEMVGKRPRQTYWKELQDAFLELDKNMASIRVNVISYIPATEAIYVYPKGITSFNVTEDVSTGYPTLDGTVETVYLDEFRMIQHYFEQSEGSRPGKVYYRQWKEEFLSWSPWDRIVTGKELDDHINNKDAHINEVDRQRLEGYQHYQAAAAKKWRIAHGLNKRPPVTIVDSGGNTVIGDVQYLDDDEIVITFTVDMIGTAYIG